jgi:hypothetical protein
MAENDADRLLLELFLLLAESADRVLLHFPFACVLASVSCGDKRALQRRVIGAPKQLALY